MTFWLVLAILTAAVALAVLVPLARSPKVSPDERNDEAVFRAQLEEIQKDLERGVIAPDMAEAAKIEVSRRLLAAHKQNQGDHQSAPSKMRMRIVQLTAVVLIPLAALGMYLQYGSPEIPDQPRAERLAETAGQADLEVLIARTEDHLKENPNDGQGWAVIAPVYMRTSQFDKARRAYAQALSQFPENLDFMVGWAEASIFANEGQVSDEVEKVLRRINLAKPEMLQPYYYLAMAMGQKGQINEALAAWNALLKTADQNAPWVDAAKAQRDELIARGAVVSGEAAAIPALGQPAGPSADEVEAAAEMSAEDRNEMINQMVVQLDERLNEQGGSVSEWGRLIQARIILGEQVEAAKAVARAKQNLKDDAAALEQINQLATSLNLSPVE
ncbi:formate-dependent nitrite reductase complex subunit NrfG [Pseudovibrio sp. Ad46]|uniref:c-type cytochrome biogenesis protein CcmI n=1 Tax=unclassified Pseudovibrio TaxID=2627060 RepID=UPI0007AE7272|nr:MULTISPECIES: c-type cytochrome biogenesis protein CcmI [unclassified Pseudovibrio]KZK86400.1 formate-dependent nitrite reductase complex subunit NrfG [Pseudovibrio sp. Ad46]KZK92122.1 formate-dependent nitrite reductase complex subunit NrfG [Pseudovibrio sp. Ad5]